MSIMKLWVLVFRTEIPDRARGSMIEIATCTRFAKVQQWTSHFDNVGLRAGPTVGFAAFGSLFIVHCVVRVHA